MALSFGMIVINGIILLHLIQLEKIGCTCAYDWRRNFIIGYAAFAMFYWAIRVFLAASNSRYSSYVQALKPIMVVATLLYSFFGIQYVHRLKQEKCACSDKYGQQVLYMVALVDIFFCTLAVLGVLMSWVFK